jgi:hypothetical protein
MAEENRNWAVDEDVPRDVGDAEAPERTKSVGGARDHVNAILVRCSNDVIRIMWHDELIKLACDVLQGQRTGYLMEVSAVFIWKRAALRGRTPVT